MARSYIAGPGELSIRFLLDEKPTAQEPITGNA
jgi:hypothetical protein